MKAWFPLLKARTVLFFAVVLAVAGLVPVLYFLSLVSWQFAALFQAGSWIPLPATLLFTDHSLLQAGKVAPVLAFIPEFPWPWLPAHEAMAWVLGRLHVGLVFALVGLPLMALGVLSALRQRALIRIHKQREADRVRRAPDYRRESSAVDPRDGRREPFIGPGGIGRDKDRWAA